MTCRFYIASKLILVPIIFNTLQRAVAKIWELMQITFARVDTELLLRELLRQNPRRINFHWHFNTM